MPAARRRGPRAALAALAAALALAGCATVPPPAPAAPASPPAFELTRDDAPGRIVLVATLHAGPPVALPPALEREIDRAGRVLVEIDADARADAVRGAATAFALLPDGTTLDDVLDAPVRDALARAYADRPGTLVAWRRLRPWALALMLPDAGGTAHGRGGLDRALLRRARARGVPVVELEAADAQVRAVADAPLPEQVALLALRLAQRETGDASFASIRDAWRCGDLAALAALKDRAFPPEGPLAALRRRLFAERDEALAAGLADALEVPGDALALIGAFHVAGPDAIGGALARRGVRVERLDAPGERCPRAPAAGPGRPLPLP